MRSRRSAKEAVRVLAGALQRESANLYNCDFVPHAKVRMTRLKLKAFRKWGNPRRPGTLIDAGRKPASTSRICQEIVPESGRTVAILYSGAIHMSDARCLGKKSPCTDCAYVVFASVLQRGSTSARRGVTSLPRTRGWRRALSTRFRVCLAQWQIAAARDLVMCL
jgi:hypothetical protein